VSDPDSPLGHRALSTVIEHVARTDATVLITGERGVGHARIARAVHARSARRREPFHELSCAAQPVERLDSELFGDDELGAGTWRRLPGKIALADAGSLLLDEVSEMPLPLQGKLLHVLQDGRVPRLGGQDLPVRARIMAASHQDLKALVDRNAFRRDLYYCLNVLPIHVPPLRERREEIPGLVQRLLARYAVAHAQSLPALSPGTLRMLVDHPWPGNLDELENLVERIVVLGTDEWVAEELRAAPPFADPAPGRPDDPGGRRRLRRQRHPGRAA
jgi:DNA-binding NtrC family response regulator